VRNLPPSTGNNCVQTGSFLASLGLLPRDPA